MTCGKINFLKKSIYKNITIEENLKKKANKLKKINFDPLNFNSLKKLRYLPDFMNNDKKDKKNKIFSINRNELNSKLFISLIVNDLNNITSTNNINVKERVFR